jgi:hypothetical protein
MHVVDHMATKDDLVALARGLKGDIAAPRGAIGLAPENRQQDDEGEGNPYQPKKHAFAEGHRTIPCVDPISRHRIGPGAKD